MLFDPQKSKRQIEILGLCLNNNDKITVQDFSLIFNISVPTIERDLRDLRGRGFSINSHAGMGVIIEQKVNLDLFKNELLRYIAICYSNYFGELIDFNFYDINKKHLLEIFVLLQKSIENRTKVRIKDINNNCEIIIEPRTIIRRNKNWILIIQKDKSFKEISIENLINIEKTEFSFTPFINDPEMYRFIDKNSNNEKLKNYKIKLSFAKPIEGNIPSQLLKVKIFREENDGKYLLNAECQKLDDLVPWIFKNVNNVLVLEPNELKNKIVNIAEIVLNKYSEVQILYSQEEISDSFYDSEDIIIEKRKIKYYNPKFTGLNDVDFDLNFVF